MFTRSSRVIGIARELFERVIAWGKSHGIACLTSDVSVTARPFFGQIGFRVVKPNVVERRGVSFQNFRMERATNVERRPSVATIRARVAANASSRNVADNDAVWYAEQCNGADRK